MHSFTTSGKKGLVKKILEKYFGCAQTHFIENLKKRHKNYFKGIISNIGVLSIAIKLTFILNHNIIIGLCDSLWIKLGEQYNII